MLGRKGWPTQHLATTSRSEELGIDCKGFQNIERKILRRNCISGQSNQKSIYSCELNRKKFVQRD